MGQSAPCGQLQESSNANPIKQQCNFNKTALKLQQSSNATSRKQQCNFNKSPCNFNSTKCSKSCTGAERRVLIQGAASKMPRPVARLLRLFQSAFGRGVYSGAYGLLLYPCYEYMYAIHVYAPIYVYRLVQP